MDSAHRQLQVGCKQTDLQSKSAVVCLAERILDVVERNDADYRSKYLLADHFHLRRYIHQYGRVKNRSFPLSSACRFCPLCDGFADPRFCPFRLFFRNHRTDICRRIGRIPHLERVSDLDRLLHEAVVHVAVHVNALNGYAGLPGVRKAACDAQFGCLAKVWRIPVDDVGRVVTQLQRDPADARRTLDVASHTRTACKGKHRDALVLQQILTRFRTKSVHHVEKARREPCFFQNFGQLHGDDRRHFRRLQHNRIARRKSRADLVHRQVEREVERSDGSDHPHRYPNGKGHLVFISRLAERNALPSDSLRLLRRSDQRLNAAIDLSPRVFEDLAYFRDQNQGQLLPALFDDVRRAHENFIALHRTQLFRMKGMKSTRYRFLHVFL